MREVKTKSKRENRPTATRSAYKRLTDCANRASLFAGGEIINLSSCFFQGLAGSCSEIEGVCFQTQMPEDNTLTPFLDK